MKRFLDLFKRESRTPIYLVSGLPRSGTSMMMKMLEAGGIQALTDNIRTADTDNPKGYYEFERAKKLPDGDTAWLPDARGRAVKVISALLEHLPDGYSYKIIFMRRAMHEILASQKKMLVNRGEDPDKVSDEEMSMLFEKHLAKVTKWLDEQKNFEVLYISFNDMLQDPAALVPRLNAFCGGGLDEEAMAEVVDPGLYRQRKGKA